MRLAEAKVLALLTQIPCVTLGKPVGALRYLTALVADGTELQAMLAQFPAVQYEPLEPHYVLLRSLGGLSDDLVSDLCVHHSWHGVVWAAFLVALAPEPGYRGHLLGAHSRTPQATWLIELAVAEIDGTACASHPEIQTLVRRLRALLALAPLPATVFPPALSEEQLRAVEAERERVSAAYRDGGLEAARAELARSPRHT